MKMAQFVPDLIEHFGRIIQMGFLAESNSGLTMKKAELFAAAQKLSRGVSHWLRVLVPMTYRIRQRSRWIGGFAAGHCSWSEHENEPDRRA